MERKKLKDPRASNNSKTAQIENCIDNLEDKI